VARRALALRFHQEEVSGGDVEGGLSGVLEDVGVGERDEGGAVSGARRRGPGGRAWSHRVPAGAGGSWSGRAIAGVDPPETNAPFAS